MYIEGRSGYFSKLLKLFLSSVWRKVEENYTRPNLSFILKRLVSSQHNARGSNGNETSLHTTSNAELE